MFIMNFDDEFVVFVYWWVWVDFNQDSDFEDLGEFLFFVAMNSSLLVFGVIMIFVGSNIGNI